MTATRRGLLQAGLAASLLGSAARAQSRTLYVNSWGGSWTAAENAAYFKPFTATTGIRVGTVEPVSYAKLRAQVQSGNYEYDVAEIGATQVLRATADGFLEPIDWSVVPRAAIPAGAVLGNRIAGCVQGNPLAYRADRFPGGGPRNWADFWDVQRFPGTRSLCATDPERNLAYALLADGVPRDKLYPLNIDRAFRKLDQIKPHIKVWWTQGNQTEQLLRDGEVDMMSCWNARAELVRRRGVPVTIVWDGCLNSFDTWAVVKGCPNQEAAWRFIALAMQPKPQAEFCSRMYYGPTNPDAFQYIDADAASSMPTQPAHASQVVAQDPAWESAHAAEIEERFAQWLAS